MSKFCKNCSAQLAFDVKICVACGTTTQVDKKQTEIGGFLSKKCTPLAVILLIGVLVISVLSGLSGCSSSIKDGSVLGKKIAAQNEAQVGDVTKNGWEMKILPSTFGGDVQLTMTVFSKEETKAYNTDRFQLYGSPVEIKVSGKENVRLGRPVSVTIKIPKDLLKDIAAEELFFAYYYDGVWEYFMPDNVNLQDGTATINVYHFSILGFGRPSEDEQIKTYAQKYAALQWESQQKTNKMTDSLSRQFDDLFSSMGVTNNSVRNQLAADVISYLENTTIDSGGVAPIDALAQMANAASKGQAGMQDFQNKLLEYTGKGLAASLEKIQNAPGKYVDKFASDVNIIGNLSSAMGYLVEGDNQGAAESIANMLKGLNPAVALASSTLDFIKENAENAIDYWTQGEIEKAYQVYIGGGAGKYGYDSGLEGDMVGIFTTLGGGQRMMNINIIKKYCEKYGINESELTQPERDRIIANAMMVLERTFKNRKVSEAEIEKRKQKEEAFISELKKVGLLSASSYQNYFGIDRNLRNFSISDRLVRLYKIKATVLSVMDKDVAAGISDEFLAKAMQQWVFWNERGERAGFYKYMREMGYIKEPLPIEKGDTETVTVTDRVEEAKQPEKKQPEKPTSSKTEDPKPTAPSPTPTPAPVPKYAWIFTGTRVNDWKTRLDTNNAANSSWRVDISASGNSVEVKNTYIGSRTDSWMRNGMSEAGKVTWTSPSDTILPDDIVSVKLTAVNAPRDHDNFSGIASIKVGLQRLDKDGKPTGNLSDWSDNNGVYILGYISGRGPVTKDPVSATMSGKLGTGSYDGQKISILIRAGGQGINVDTEYIYEWKQVD